MTETKTAVEKACDVITSMDGPMTKPCPVCRGGWWAEGDVTIAGVHVKECPYSGKELVVDPEVTA